MIFYCSHKYGGDPDNKLHAENIIAELQKNDLGNTYLSPIHALGFTYDILTYDDGMELCLDLLCVCDELLVLSEPSEGVQREIDAAKRLGIPVRFIKEDIE